MHEARILADSISPQGHRLTTFVGTFPRIVLAELNTHRDFSRNSASSRAVKIEKMIRMVEENPYVPTHWGRNQSGMQAEQELTPEEIEIERREWLEDRDYAVMRAKRRAERGLHKQLTNRLLEPFMWHTAVITATEWDNFFHQRCHPAAHPEIRKLAELMRDARDASTPKELTPTDAHLPFIYDEDREEALRRWMGPNPLRVMENLEKVSVARCARVSYLTHDGKRDLDEDLGLYGRLVGPGHMSPLEHVARPMNTREYSEARAWSILVELPGSGGFYREIVKVAAHVQGVIRRYEEQGARILNSRETHFCGNFNGWIQHRKLIPREYDVLGAA